MLNTNQIIELISSRFEKEFNFKSINYTDWLTSYRFWELHTTTVLPSQVTMLFPMKESLTKRVYYTLYNKMPFEREFILKHYEQKHDDIEYLFYPSKAATKLVVFFSGYSSRKTYNRYSWYWDEKQEWDNDTAYLFLNDVTNSWYCGVEGLQRTYSYQNLILDKLRSLNLCEKNAYFIGGSMGGYGAIRLGFKLDVGGIIAINPQTSIEAVKLHNDKAWSENITKCGSQFIPVYKCIELAEGSTPLYFECGKYVSDHYDVGRITSELSKKRATFFFNLHDSQKHVTASPTKKKIESLINLFEDEFISLKTGEEDANSMDVK